MIRFIAGEKGQGKTKQIIEMANSAAKTTDGHLVYIEKDRRHIYDLQHDVRFVEAQGFTLSNYGEFIGFLCGILSQDSDIKEIYIDGLTKIVESINNEDLVSLVKRLEKLSEENSVDFIVGINYKSNELPKEITDYLC